MNDLLIRGGIIVDGTGAPPRSGDVAVRDGRIVDAGSSGGSAHRVIEADGALVTPGFVDIHTHYDAQAIWDEHLTPSCWHGVTTALLGNCGVGFAPAAPDRHEWLIGLMEGVEDIPREALVEGIRWDWESFPEYLDALERLPHALDLGSHVAHGAVRAYVMGERGARNEPATPDDVAAMSKLVAAALEGGALGFSTNRTLGHRALDGEPVPGTYADEAELLGLCEGLARARYGVLQLVPAGVGGTAAGDPEDAPEKELELILRLARAVGQPVTFLVMQSHSKPDRWRGHFERVRAAHQEGLRIYPQVAARSFGFLVGYQSKLNPFATRPSYAALADLPLVERVRRLRQPETRARILAEKPERGAEGTNAALAHPSSFGALFPLGDPPDYEPPPEASVAAIAEREGRPPAEVAYDLMLRRDGKELLTFPILNYGHGCYDGIYEMLSDPLSVQGLGDGGAHCGIVCDASMTTYLLSHWVRDRTRGPRLPLELAVRRLTRDAAALYGLNDRGVIAPGAKADLNVIDLERLQLAPPELAHDLPAGASRMIQRSEGYIATLVAGEAIAEEGELTDARPGRVVRGPQAL